MQGAFCNTPLLFPFLLFFAGSGETEDYTPCGTANTRKVLTMSLIPFSFSRLGGGLLPAVR